jgi:hypothetical protein
MTIQNKTKHAEYTRNWRIKQKEKKDTIDNNTAKQDERRNQVKKTNKLEKTDIYSNSAAREVEKNMQTQYPNEKEDYNFSLWGSVTKSQPKNKNSHQEILRQEFGNYSE